mmetsp:Transcript_12913/g.14953  ORF Transcript_12913/g.14953 Transcript_12913/m.14953 type:complete len:372 (-) Transcript_12913:1322-2437(-)
MTRPAWVKVLVYTVIFGLLYSVYTQRSYFLSTKENELDSSFMPYNPFRQHEDSRPINLVFFHDPKNEYGQIGSPLLVNSVMEFTKEPHNIRWHLIIQKQWLEKTQEFVDLMKEKFPALSHGAGGVEIHVVRRDPEFDILAKRVHFQNMLCRNTRILEHHFALSSTLPKDIGKIIMLDSDMMVKADIAELWDLVTPQLKNDVVIAAHQNCRQKYAKYFKSRGPNARLLPDPEYANSTKRCSYDNGIIALDMSAPRIQSFLNDTVKTIVEQYKNFDNMRFVACTRDMMNVMLARHYGPVGIPSSWMLGGACSKPDDVVAKSNLLHFSGNTKLWQTRRCKSDPLLKLGRELCASSKGLPCDLELKRIIQESTEA